MTLEKIYRDLADVLDEVAPMPEKKPAEKINNPKEPGKWQIACTDGRYPYKRMEDGRSIEDHHQDWEPFAVDDGDVYWRRRE